VIAVGIVIGGRLRVDQLLGAGGMGVVVVATHLELGHRVAVKVLHDELAQSPSIVERFIREARSVVQLRTEHVCRVLDVGRLDTGAPYIMMELLEGVDLARAIAHRPLPVPLAVDYIAQACVALAEAHAAGIVHRDLKPANLFVIRRPDGSPLLKVLDFGIAKAMTSEAHLTQSSGLLGSPGYMSPEQIQSPRDVDARTDIWALGATLYQLVSGRLPFMAPNATEVAIKIASEPPAPLDVDPALHAIIWRCLAKPRAERYPDAVSLAQDLARVGGQGAARAAASLGSSVPVAASAPIAVTAATAPGTMATAAPSMVPALPPVRSRRWIWLVAATVVAAAAVVAAFIARSHATATPRDAAPAARAIDAAPPPPVDAAPPPFDAAPPPPDAMLATVPVDAGKGRPVGMDVAMAKAMESMRKGCTATVNNPQLLKLVPQTVTMCWCALGDAAKAQAVFATLPQAQRAPLIAQCKNMGITLTP
jgi:hypothetical protein